MFSQQEASLTGRSANAPMGLLGRALSALLRRFSERALLFVNALPDILEKAIPLWIAAVLSLAAFKIAAAPVAPGNFPEFADLFVPYALLALVPILALRLANLAYPPDRATPRLTFHLSVVGTWHPIRRKHARRLGGFGPYGLMACLMFGLILNVPVRAAEFMLAVPAIHGAAPDWGRAIFMAMAADVMAMSFLYMVCFVMAYRAVPLFPRMLLATWLFDILLQFAIASVAASYPSLPPDVSLALTELLQGNIVKVLISMGVWLPYLILSNRVNLTYRSRIRKA